MKYSLGKRVSEIQEVVNSRQSKLQKKNAGHMLQSCIRAIRTTEYALEGYLSEVPDSSKTVDTSGSLSIGKTYLYIYGALQALYVQQDAVKNLCRALGVDYPEYSVKKIREIRNDAVGHPTDRNYGKEFHFILDSPTTDRIDFLTSYPGIANERGSIGFFRLKFVNIPHLIETQKNNFIEVLDDVIEKLKVDSPTA